MSTILCSFFYGDLEKEFTTFSEHPGSVSGMEMIIFTEFKVISQAMFRLIDDYMFITTSLPKAREFLDMMVKGLAFT